MNPNDVGPVLAMMTLTIVAGLVFIFRGPVGKAIARRLEGGGALSADAEARLQELEARVTDLERERLELGDRLEFAERLLGQVRDGQREPS